jgi:diguanylate cyclase (GGDEF)-like protein
LIRADDGWCPDPIIVVDAAGRSTFMNSAAAGLARGTDVGLSGIGIAEIGAIFGDGLAVGIEAVLTSRAAQRTQTLCTSGGTTHWLDVWIVPRGVGEAVCVARDITEMKRAENQLRDSVGRDSLTSLLNHAAFHDEVSRALSLDGSDRADVGLVLFDLDYLKLINDVHGHRKGDEALRAVAEALRATTRHADRVARLGGDEFGALFVDVDRADVVRVAQRAVAKVCSTVLPGVGRLSTSAGVAFVASTREPGDLFDRADAAVYDAKARGRGVVSVAETTDIAYASHRRDVAHDRPSPLPPELADANDVVTAARGALREWVHVLACSGGCLDLLDAEGDSVKAVAYYRFGHDDWKLAEQTYSLTDYPNTAAALADGQPYTCRVDDPDGDPSEASLLRERGFSSLLLTPLVSRGRSIGIIELFDTRPRTFTSQDQRLALALAHHLASLLAVLQEGQGNAAPRSDMR